MKKIAIILGMALLLTGCSEIQNAQDESKEPTPSTINITNDNVTLELKEDTLTSIIVTFILTNNSDEPIFYGDDFRLERKQDDNWYKVKSKDKLYFYLQPHQLNPDESIKVGVNMLNTYGQLESGLYRLVKGYRYNNSKEDLYVAAEFTIN